MTEQFDLLEQDEVGPDDELKKSMSSELDQVLLERAEEKRKELSREYQAKILDLRMAEKATPERIQKLHEEYKARGLEGGPLFDRSEADEITNQVMERAKQRMMNNLADQYRQAMRDASGNPRMVAQVKKRFADAGVDVDHTPIFGGR